MVKSLRMFGLVVILLLGLASFGTTSAQTQPVCDTSGSVNGTATPTYGTVGTVIIFQATGFTPGEAVSFWLTLPDGSVAGTAAPLEGGVNPDGTIGPLPLPIDDVLVSLAPGRWAITFQGASSGHTAVIYFCVLTQAEATAIAQPTAVPPTATTAATATTQPTIAPTTAVTPTVQATVEVSPTAQATVAVSPTVAPPTVAPTLPPLPPIDQPLVIVPTLAVYDQVLVDNSVLVDRVEALQDGWVVIHESNPDGTIMLPGIIGKTMVKAGASGGFLVPLDKKVENGAKLWPMLHIDAGTIGEYEFPGPDVPVTVNGEIVM
ncbi:MAG TPA: hypothetical protein VEX13_09640, partial [Chloroflexia bacterium]|nr:hypothetical protein [Chloroflexia bacterium]